MAAYALLPVGVLVTATGQRIIPQSGALWEEYIDWRKAGNVPDPYVPPASPAESLAEAKARRRWQIQRDGLTRMQSRFPALDSFGAVQLVREIYLSVAPAARVPTVDALFIINTYTAGMTALDAVNAATTIAQVDAVAPAWPA
jgi:hypothetical protein